MDVAATRQASHRGAGCRLCDEGDRETRFPLQRRSPATDHGLAIASHQKVLASTERGAACASGTLRRHVLFQRKANFGYTTKVPTRSRHVSVSFWAHTTAKSATGAPPVLEMIYSVTTQLRIRTKRGSAPTRADRNVIQNCWHCSKINVFGFVLI
jgi:hypothetical protein